MYKFLVLVLYKIVSLRVLGLEGGEIAGIAVGGAFLLTLSITGAIFCFRYNSV